MDRRLAVPPVVRPAERLAVDGDQPVLGDLLQGLNPTQQASLECGWVEAGEDPSEGVVGGDAVTQVEVASEPLPAVATELLDAGERVGPGEHTADGDEEDIDQRVLSGPLDARVIEVVEVVVERGRLAAEHGDDPSKAGHVVSVG